MSSSPSSKPLTMMLCVPRDCLQSIKELAASRCSKSDLIGCMEEFVKQRRESLAPQAAATFDAKDTTSNGGTEEAEAEISAGSPAYAIRGSSKKPKRERSSRSGTPRASPGSSPRRAVRRLSCLWFLRPRC
jgi:hypothetical protein